MSQTIRIHAVDYIASRDASQALGISRQKLAQYCKESRIPAMRFRRKWYVEARYLKDSVAPATQAKAPPSPTSRRVTPHALPVASPLQATAPAAEARRLVTRLSDPENGGAVISHAPAGMAQASLATLQAAHVPAHLISPIGEVAHRLLALAFAITITVGAFSLIMPASARVAFARGGGPSVALDAGGAALSSVETGFVAIGNAQLAAIAQVASAFAAQSSSFGATT